MADELTHWLGSLSMELTTALADEARRWLADLNDAHPHAARPMGSHPTSETNDVWTPSASPLENSLDDLLKQLRCHVEQEGNYEQYQLTPCPTCGKAALRTTKHRTQAMWTDDYSGEEPFERSIEVVQLAPGFTLSCRDCGYGDGEGATY